MLLISAGYVCKKDLRQFRNQEGERTVAENLDKYLHACMLSHFSYLQLFGTLWTVARQAPLSMGFFRQEYWSELSCPPPGDLPDPRIEPLSPMAPALQADSLPLSHRGNPVSIYSFSNPRRPESAVMPRCFDGERPSDVSWILLVAYSDGWKLPTVLNECILCLHFSKHILPPGAVKFLSTVAIQLYSGNDHYLGKVLVWSSLGVGNLLC